MSEPRTFFGIENPCPYCRKPLALDVHGPCMDQAERDWIGEDPDCKCGHLMNDHIHDIGGWNPVLATCKICSCKVYERATA